MFSSEQKLEELKLKIAELEKKIEEEKRNEEFARRQMDIDILRRKMQRFSDENGGQEIDWVDKLEAKWCLEVACDNGVMKIALIHYAEYRSPFQVYFATGKIAEQAMKLFGDEIVRLYS